jgi:hypothetical protein
MGCQVSHPDRTTRTTRLVAWAGLATAIVSVAVAIWNVHATHVALQVDNLLKMDERFNREDMLRTRSIAADNLLQHRETPELDDILDFCDSLGLLVRKGTVDDEMAWSFFADLEVYVAESAKFIARAQHDDPATWTDAVWLMARFKRWGGRPVTRGDAHQYLMDETQRAAARR